MRRAKLGITDEILNWMIPILRKNLFAPNLFKAIENGELLCELVQAIQSRVQCPYSKGALPRSSFAKSNIKNFLVACKQMGVSSHNLFKPRDLYKRFNDRRVVRCLLYFILACTKWDYPLPKCLHDTLVKSGTPLPHFSPSHALFLHWGSPSGTRLQQSLPLDFGHCFCFWLGAYPAALLSDHGS